MNFSLWVLVWEFSKQLIWKERSFEVRVMLVPVFGTITDTSRSIRPEPEAKTFGQNRSIRYVSLRSQFGPVSSCLNRYHQFPLSFNEILNLYENSP